MTARLYVHGLEVRPLVVLCDDETRRAHVVGAQPVVVMPEDLADWAERKWPEHLEQLEREAIAGLEARESAAEDAHEGDGPGDGAATDLEPARLGSDDDDDATA
jgi:hypothetical protein